MTTTITSARPDLARLLAALRAANWDRTVESQPAPRFPDGSPDGEGWLVHSWARGTERITLWQSADSGDLEFAITYDPDHYDEDGGSVADTRLMVGLGWVNRHGVGRLHRMAEVAGLLAAGGTR